MEVVHGKFESGDALDAPVAFPSGQEDDVGDAGGQVDRRGAAQLHDAKTSCRGIGMDASEYQHPPPGQRLVHGVGDGHRSPRRRDRYRRGGLGDDRRLRSGRYRGRGGRRLHGLDLFCFGLGGHPDGPGGRHLMCCSRPYVGQQPQEGLLVDDGYALGNGPPGFRGTGRRVVGDQHAGVPADGGHHVQPGGHRPADQLRPGVSGVAGDRDLHALPERPAGCQTSRIAVSTGGLRRTRGELGLRPRWAGHQWQGQIQSGRLAQRRPQDAGEYPGVVQCVVRPLLGDAVVGGERAQLHVVRRRVHLAVQGQGAQSLRDRQPHPCPGELMGEEVVVELGVVSHQDTVLEHRADPPGHLVEGGRAFQPLGGESVDIDRPGIAAGVEERRELPGLLTVRTERDHRDGQHTVPPGHESRGLDIDQGPVIGVITRGRNVQEGRSETHGGQDDPIYGLHST